MTTRCKHWSDAIFPETLTDKNGTEQATVTALKGKRAVGVLFSAHWWSPCRDFASDLAVFYNASRKWNKNTFEIVFVSSDRNGGAFRECLNSMPWLAVPYGETAATSKLVGICKVRDIPALVIFDGATGEILSTTGCDDVSKAKESIGNPRAVVRRWLNRGQEANERELWTLKAAEAVMGIAAVALTVYLKRSYEHNKYFA